jgi:hypothetical protein
MKTETSLSKENIFFLVYNQEGGTLHIFFFFTFLFIFVTFARKDENKKKYFKDEFTNKAFVFLLADKKSPSRSTDTG